MKSPLIDPIEIASAVVAQYSFGRLTLEETQASLVRTLAMPGWHRFPPHTRLHVLHLSVCPGCLLALAAMSRAEVAGSPLTCSKEVH